jgi:hypothetical protein
MPACAARSVRIRRTRVFAINFSEELFDGMKNSIDKRGEIGDKDHIETARLAGSVGGNPALFETVKRLTPETVVSCRHLMT